MERQLTREPRTLTGSVQNLTGDVDACGLTAGDREKGINVIDLVQEDETRWNKNF